MKMLDDNIGGLIDVTEAIAQIKRYKETFGITNYHMGVGFLFEGQDFERIIRGILFSVQGIYSLSDDQISQLSIVDMVRIYLGVKLMDNGHGTQKEPYLSAILVPVKLVESTNQNPPEVGIHEKCSVPPFCSGRFKLKDANNIEKYYTTEDAYFQFGSENMVMNVSLPCPPYACDTSSAFFQAYL